MATVGLGRSAPQAIAQSLYVDDPQKRAEAAAKVQQDKAKKSGQFGAAGQAVGSMFGPLGSAIGGALGSALGGIIGGKGQLRSMQRDQAMIGLGLDPNNPNSVPLYYGLTGVPVNQLSNGLRASGVVLGGGTRRGPVQTTQVGMDDLVSQYNAFQNQRGAVAPPQSPYAGFQGFGPSQMGPGPQNPSPGFSGSGNPFFGNAPTFGPGMSALAPISRPQTASMTANPFEAMRQRLRTGQGGFSMPDYIPGTLATPQPQKMS